MSAPAGQLAEAQIRLLELLAQGLSNDAIGRRLTIPEDTVKSRLGVLYRKLGARDRAQAVALAYQAKLLPVPDGSGSDHDQTRQKLLDAQEREIHRLIEQLAVALVENAAMRRELRLRAVDAA